MNNRPRRWFFYSLIGLFLFLSLAIILAAILLLRRGKLPRTGVITGSSMEPVLRGPRFTWTCPSCSQTQEFAIDTCKSHVPLRCRWCGALDPKSAVDFDDLESIAERIRPGDEVRYATLRSIRSLRAAEIAIGTSQPNGLVRGDIVVFQEAQGAKREVKRVVGFASEQISIASGDVWVNGQLWCKSLEQSLRQSILLDAWDGAKSTQDNQSQNPSRPSWTWNDGPFNGVLSPQTIQPEDNAGITSEIKSKLAFVSPTNSYLDNQLAVNAHDSHVILPILDFGFAFQVMTPDASWEIRCQMHSPTCDPEMSIEWNGSELTLNSGADRVVSPIIDIQAKPIWIVIAMVDGYLIGGSQNEEWFRSKLPSGLEDSAKEKLGVRSPIEITPISGNLAIDQLLVFRDIYYRGQGDSDTQNWEPGNQLIVLGDNVSASSDARDRWPDGLPTNSVKGVVLQTESPTEVLLRQRR